MNCRGGQKERVILTLPGETLASQTPLLICKQWIQWIPVEGNIIHEQPIYLGMFSFGMKNPENRKNGPRTLQMSESSEIKSGETALRKSTKN